MSNLPSFMIKENEKNKDLIIISRDGKAVILAYFIGTVYFTYKSVKYPTWDNITFATISSVALMIWTIAFIHVKKKLKIENKKT